MRDALDTAKRGADVGNSQAINDLTCLLPISGDLETNYASESTHLSDSHVVIWMGGQSWVVDGPNARVFLKEFSNPLSAFILLPNPEIQGLETA